MNHKHHKLESIKYNQIWFTAGDRGRPTLQSHGLTRRRFGLLGCHLRLSEARRYMKSAEAVEHAAAAWEWLGMAAMEEEYTKIWIQMDSKMV